MRLEVIIPDTARPELQAKVADLVRRHEPDFAAFHKTLTAAGKPKKVIRIALARKLLVRLNAKARDVRKELGLAV